MKKHHKDILLVTFSVVSIYWAYNQVIGSRGETLAEGARLHQSLLINLLLEPDTFVENLKKMPPEIQEVVREKPELYRMTKNYQKWQSEVKKREELGVGI